jgi:hypothetical protein
VSISKYCDSQSTRRHVSHDLNVNEHGGEKPKTRVTSDYDFVTKLFFFFFFFFPLKT